MNYNLLIADDEELIRKGLIARLEYLQITFQNIYEAATGQEALEILKNYKVDIVVTDIRMPQMGGLELMQEAGKIQKGISFLILSGYAEFEYAKRALELGAKAYLLKPLSNEKGIYSAFRSDGERAGGEDCRESPEPAESGEKGIWPGKGTEPLPCGPGVCGI